MSVRVVRFFGSQAVARRSILAGRCYSEADTIAAIAIVRAAGSFSMTTTASNIMMLSRRFLFAATILLLLASFTRADTFYVVVFGAVSDPHRPKYSHSWATFVRIPDDRC